MYSVWDSPSTFMYVTEIEFRLGQQAFYLLNHLLYFGVGHLTSQIHHLWPHPCVLRNMLNPKSFHHHSSLMQREASVFWFLCCGSHLPCLYKSSQQTCPMSGRISTQVIKAMQTLNIQFPLWESETVHWRQSRGQDTYFVPPVPDVWGVGRSLYLVLALLPILGTLLRISFYSWEKWAIHLPSSADDGNTEMQKLQNAMEVLSHRAQSFMPRGRIPRSPYKKDIQEDSDMHTTRSRSHSIWN